MGNRLAYRKVVDLFLKQFDLKKTAPKLEKPDSPITFLGKFFEFRTKQTRKEVAMKIKSAIFAAFAVAALSFSVAWAAEKPMPGDTPEETAKNKAVLVCKTQWPGIVEATTAAFSGKSLEEVRAILKKRFENDEAAGSYYASVNDKQSYVEKTSATFHKTGEEFSRNEEVKTLAPAQFRKTFAYRINEYLQSCVPSNTERFR